ncbi:hypothetical protein ACFYXF_35055 [Streptomyces sp. NPDC002680]|uniref:hypothetical protein n=1 Tax=Streptomyces sp. NPDC002680 TaxID=3364659 RepID=UPI00369585A4
MDYKDFGVAYVFVTFDYARDNPTFRKEAGRRPLTSRARPRRRLTPSRPPQGRRTSAGERACEVTVLHTGGKFGE